MTKTQYFYSPFTKSNISFFITENSKLANEIFFIFKDVNLYYQPLPDTKIAGVFLFVRLLLIVLGEFLHVKLYKLIKRENGLVKNVTRLFTVTQMVFWPFWLILTTSTDFVHPLKAVIGRWYCTFNWFFFYYGWIIISFHSCIVALLRYCFILHSKKVEKIGKEKVKTIFFFASFLVPLLVVIWAAIEGSELNAMSFINKCYGNHHKVFLIDTSTLNVVKRNFCQFEVLETHHKFGMLISLLRRVSCVTKTTLMLVMGFNISEGLVYCKVLSYIYRYQFNLISNISK